MSETEWLSELKCSVCESVLYLQVGDQNIPDKQREALKCCEGMELKVTYTPVENQK